MSCQSVVFRDEEDLEIRNIRSRRGVFAKLREDRRPLKRASDLWGKDVVSD